MYKWVVMVTTKLLQLKKPSTIPSDFSSEVSKVWESYGAFKRVISIDTKTVHTEKRQPKTDHKNNTNT